MRNRMKKRRTLRMVDLYLNDSLFQMKGMRSRNTFFPALGVLGRRRSAGSCRVSFAPAIAVAARVAIRMTAKVIKKKAREICDVKGGSV